MISNETQKAEGREPAKAEETAEADPNFLGLLHEESERIIVVPTSNVSPEMAEKIKAFLDDELRGREASKTPIVVLDIGDSPGVEPQGKRKPDGITDALGKIARLNDALGSLRQVELIAEYHERRAEAVKGNVHRSRHKHVAAYVRKIAAAMGRD